ncbi:hypothetical protein KsCSTR_24390 [Candidatus Kuenenia stuttgartiensis]|uniref:Uncharacterized protein n=1 Tax=Kuenenia stuttgartiensis TaxID=174633 RepID=A0A6G7GQF5_KUEST|nr:hypothetical protein KsCSTR_24390 [Candidatus Kuenenia stuttgartiensis]
MQWFCNISKTEQSKNILIITIKQSFINKRVFQFFQTTEKPFLSIVK